MKVKEGREVKEEGNEEGRQRTEGLYEGRKKG
jgi:hypothetical protein